MSRIFLIYSYMTVHKEFQNSGSFSWFHELEDGSSGLFFPMEEVIIVEQVKRRVHWSLVFDTSFLQAPLWENPWDKKNKKRLTETETVTRACIFITRKEAMACWNYFNGQSMNVKQSVYLYALNLSSPTGKQSPCHQIITTGWHCFHCFTKRILCHCHFPSALSFMSWAHSYGSSRNLSPPCRGGEIAGQAIRMSEYHRKLQEERRTYPVFMHCRPSAHLGESLDKIPLVHDSPSFLSSWHFPPSNTWTKQKRPALHWLSSSHGDPARPVRSEKQIKLILNKIKHHNTLTIW